MRIFTVSKLSRAFFLSCCLPFSLLLLSEKAVYPLFKVSATENSSKAPTWPFMWAKSCTKQGSKSLSVQVPRAGLLVPLLELVGKKLDFLRRRNHRNVPRFRPETRVVQRLWLDWYFVWKNQNYRFIFPFLLENHSYLKISGKPVSELSGIALIYVGVRHNRFMSIMCMLSQFFTDLCKIIMKTPWEWMLFVLIWTQDISKWEVRYCF